MILRGCDAGRLADFRLYFGDLTAVEAWSVQLPTEGES